MCVCVCVCVCGLYPGAYKWGGVKLIHINLKLIHYNNYLYYFTIITNIVILSTSFLSRLGKARSIVC